TENRRRPSADRVGVSIVQWSESSRRGGTPRGCSAARRAGHSPRVVRGAPGHYPSDGGRSRPYMLSILLVSTVAVAPEWTLLAFPRPTRALEAGPIEPVLLDAAHLDVDGSLRPAAVEMPEPPLPPAIFQQMLDETLRQRGQKLETRPQAGLLLARGE